MSEITVATAPLSPAKSSGNGASIWPVLFGLSVALAVFMLAASIARAGWTDYQALSTWTANGAARQGRWMSEMMLSGIRMLPVDGTIQQSIWMASSALAFGLAGAGLWHGLLRAQWWWPTTVLAVGSTALAAPLLYTVSFAVGTMPLLVAGVLVVLSLRRLEQVPDVQAVMNLSFCLPLLLLSGPQLAPLLIPLCLAGALHDPEARHNPGVLGNWLLVTLLPTLFGLIAITLYAAQLGLDFAGLLDGYRSSYGAAHWAGLAPALVGLILQAPFVLLPIIAAGLNRQWPAFSAIAVLALPAYLAGGAAVFGWSLGTWAPQAMAMVVFASWLATRRTALPLQVSAALLLTVSSVIGWISLAGISETLWKGAVLSLF